MTTVQAASLILHNDGDRLACRSKQSSLITIIRLKNSDAVFSADDKAVGERVHRVDAASFRRVRHIALILTIVGTEKHLTIVSADKDHTSGLRP